ncbi:MAG: hypothetical protein AAB388_00605 [Patescibacteria group bacterium]
MDTIDPALVDLVASRLGEQTFDSIVDEGHESLTMLTQEQRAEVKRQAEEKLQNQRLPSSVLITRAWQI